MERFNREVCKRTLHQLATEGATGFSIPDGTLMILRTPPNMRLLTELLVDTKRRFSDDFKFTINDGESDWRYLIVNYSVILSKDDAIDFVVDFLLYLVIMFQVED